MFVQYVCLYAKIFSINHSPACSRNWLVGWRLVIVVMLFLVICKFVNFFSSWYSFYLCCLVNGIFVVRLLCIILVSKNCLIIITNYALCVVYGRRIRCNSNVMVLELLGFIECLRGQLSLLNTGANFFHAFFSLQCFFFTISFFYIFTFPQSISKHSGFKRIR